MTIDHSRRVFLAAAPAAALAGVMLAPTRTRGQSPEAYGATPNGFPQQDPALVRDIVGASHVNIDRVRELLAQQPELAKASYDWGFGDWETALGAASHTGRVEIAELLLAHGARPTLFSAAMLGQLSVVRAFIEAQPGVQRTPGPHGITLLRHARAGGERAAKVVEYLESVGGADISQATAPIDAAQSEPCVGVYAWGAAEAQRFVVELRERGLFLTPFGGSARGLAHHGELVFSPAGAPSVRISFDAPAGQPARSVRVVGVGVDLTAQRVDS